MGLNSTQRMRNDDPVIFAGAVVWGLTIEIESDALGPIPRSQRGAGQIPTPYSFGRENRVFSLSGFVGSEYEGQIAINFLQEQECNPHGIFLLPVMGVPIDMLPLSPPNFFSNHYFLKLAGYCTDVALIDFIEELP